MNPNTLVNYTIAQKQLQEAAFRMGTGVAEMASILQDFSVLAKDVTFMPGDAEHEYKTLNLQHEIL